jgi:adenylate cyclase
MSDSEILANYLSERSRSNADRAVIDAAIFSHFGRTQAVMFTDLVGFSRLVEAFGILHFLQLIQESEALFLPMIAQHGGSCLKREGDSLLAVFDDPAQALTTARAMVAATVALNPPRPPEERIEVCIGLGFGTVLRVDGDVWGAQVNAASKLGEEMAKGGDILVTQDFRAALAEVNGFAPHGTLFDTQSVFRWQDDLGLPP